MISSRESLLFHTIMTRLDLFHPEYTILLQSYDISILPFLSKLAYLSFLS